MMYRGMNRPLGMPPRPMMNPRAMRGGRGMPMPFYRMPVSTENDHHSLMLHCNESCVDIFISNKLPFNPSKTSPCFYVSGVQVFWQHCGKRRNCS